MSLDEEGTCLDWDRHEDEILDLFISQNKPLREVKERMRKTHHFNPTYAPSSSPLSSHEHHPWNYQLTGCCRERQYKHRFPRLKNVTGEEWASIADEFQRRAAVGKQTVVCLYGKPLPSDRVRRALGRARSGSAYRITKPSSNRELAGQHKIFPHGHH